MEPGNRAAYERPSMPPGPRAHGLYHCDPRAHARGFTMSPLRGSRFASRVHLGRDAPGVGGAADEQGEAADEEDAEVVGRQVAEVEAAARNEVLHRLLDRHDDGDPEAADEQREPPDA